MRPIFCHVFEYEICRNCVANITNTTVSNFRELTELSDPEIANDDQFDYNAYLHSYSAIVVEGITRVRYQMGLDTGRESVPRKVIEHHPASSQRVDDAAVRRTGGVFYSIPQKKKRKIKRNGREQDHGRHRHAHGARQRRKTYCWVLLAAVRTAIKGTIVGRQQVSRLLAAQLNTCALSRPPLLSLRAQWQFRLGFWLAESVAVYNDTMNDVPYLDPVLWFLTLDTIWLLGTFLLFSEMLQQPSPHGLQQQHPSDDLYANSNDLIHHQQQQHHLHLQQQQHHSGGSAAALPMDLHLPQGYPFYTSSHTQNSNSRYGADSFRFDHFHLTCALKTHIRFLLRHRIAQKTSTLSRNSKLRLVD